MINLSKIQYEVNRIAGFDVMIQLDISHDGFVFYFEWMDRELKHCLSLQISDIEIRSSTIKVEDILIFEFERSLKNFHEDD